MASLLDRIKGVEVGPENGPEVPDTVPAEWAGLTPDPEPGDAPPTKAPKAPIKVTPVGPALKKRIAAEIEMYIEFAAMPILLRDPVCGGAIHEQAEPIAAAITQILAKYPEIAHKFLATGAVGDWIKLAVALQPVGKIVWEHHVTKAGQDEGVPVDLTNFDVYRPGQ
jgi:hypothetical protein